MKNKVSGNPFPIASSKYLLFIVVKNKSTKTYKYSKNQIFFYIKRQFYIFIMTTAARPTFDAARGGTAKGERDLSAMSKQYSSRDL